MNIPASSTPPVPSPCGLKTARHSAPLSSLLRRSWLMGLLLGAAAPLPTASRAATPVETVVVAEHADTTDDAPAVDTTINTRILNSPLAHSQFNGAEYIFFTYINGAGNIAVRRITESNLSYTGAVTWNEYLLRDPVTGNPVVVQNDPNHVTSSIGIDEDGYLHVAGNMHHHSWQYWVSNNPRDVSGGFTFKGVPLGNSSIGAPNVDASGKFISPPGYSITYPYFANDRAGRLYVGFRHQVGKAANGNVYPYKGLCGGGIAQYNKVSKRWKMIGGNDYSLPSVTVPRDGSLVNLPTTFYQQNGTPDQRTGTGYPDNLDWYQNFNNHFWFDNYGWLRVTTQLYTPEYPVTFTYPVRTPSRIAYAIGVYDTIDAEGFQTWKWQRADGTFLTGAHALGLAAGDQGLPAGGLGGGKPGEGLLQTAIKRVADATFGGQSFIGTTRTGPGTTGSNTPIISFLCTPAWTTSSAVWWVFRDASGAWVLNSPTFQYPSHIWTGPNSYTRNDLSPTSGNFCSQGPYGKQMITSLYPGSKPVWRSNDRGDTTVQYPSAGLNVVNPRMDYRYSNMYSTNTTEDRVRYVSIDAAGKAHIYTLIFTP